MKKRTIILFIALTSLITALSTTIWYNLKANSVYYAKHIPHKEGENPELVFIIDNLTFIPKPNKFLYKSYRHEILPQKGKILRYNFLSYQEGYMIFNSNSISHVWDQYGRFSFSMNYHSEEKLTDNHYKETAEKELNAIIDPIIKVQREPDINLQWLFNWIYRDRFNQ